LRAIRLVHLLIRGLFCLMLRMDPPAELPRRSSSRTQTYTKSLDRTETGN
jgi:hypothetical protein